MTRTAHEVFMEPLLAGWLPAFCGKRGFSVAILVTKSVKKLSKNATSSNAPPCTSPCQIRNCTAMTDFLWSEKCVLDERGQVGLSASH